MYNKSVVKRGIKTRHLSPAVTITYVLQIVDLAVNCILFNGSYYIGLLFTIKEKMSVGNSKLYINDLGSQFHFSTEYEKIARIM